MTHAAIIGWAKPPARRIVWRRASAFYLEATDKEEGLLAEELGCYGEVRDILTVHGWGMKYANQGIPMGQSKWQFEGQKIFKKAVDGMVSASEKVLEKCGLTESDIDLVIPHQANLRIINAVAKKLGKAEIDGYLPDYNYVDFNKDRAIIQQ